MKLTAPSPTRARSAAELPLFPVAGALLLPRRPIQLTVFEPRYLAMLDDALSGERLIGMIQPKAGDEAVGPSPELCEIGCLGRIVQYAEIGDGRCFLSLMGVTRFRLAEEMSTLTPYRIVRADYAPFAAGLRRGRGRGGRRPRRAAEGAARIRQGQRPQDRLGRHPRGLERDARQFAGDHEPLWRAREAGDAGGRRPEIAGRDPGRHRPVRHGPRRRNAAPPALSQRARRARNPSAATVPPHSPAAPRPRPGVYPAIAARTARIGPDLGVQRRAGAGRPAARRDAGARCPRPGFRRVPLGEGPQPRRQRRVAGMFGEQAAHRVRDDQAVRPHRPGRAKPPHEREAEPFVLGDRRRA